LGFHYIVNKLFPIGQTLGVKIYKSAAMKVFWRALSFGHWPLVCTCTVPQQTNYLLPTYPYASTNYDNLLSATFCNFVSCPISHAVLCALHTHLACQGFRITHMFTSVQETSVQNFARTYQHQLNLCCSWRIPMQPAIPFATCTQLLSLFYPKNCLCFFTKLCSFRHS
jgi:hypothetical protein